MSITTAPPDTANLGREDLPWTQDIWDRIDQAVHDECQRTKVAAKFLPCQGPTPTALTVPSDTILGPPDTEVLAVDEGATVSLIEVWVDFKLTRQQVEDEEHLCTAHTLATRAANLLAQAEDLLIFLGDSAVERSLFQEGSSVHARDRSLGAGLVASAPADQHIPVDPVESPGQGYGTNTFKAVTKGYGRLVAKGQYGPYALVLETEEYADTFAPLANTLIMPADRIKPIVTEHMVLRQVDMVKQQTVERFYATGTLPGRTGVLVSLGGNTMDMVVGVPAVTAHTQVDGDGCYRFRVFERFVLRVKDNTAVIVFDFK